MVYYSLSKDKQNQLIHGHTLVLLRQVLSESHRLVWYQHGTRDSSVRVFTDVPWVYRTVYLLNWATLDLKFKTLNRGQIYPL